MTDHAPTDWAGRVLPSRVERVTFFEDRAEVVRLAEVEAEPGSFWVRVDGVALTIHDDSLLASVTSATDGETRVVAARVLRRVREVPAAEPSQLAEHEAEWRRAEAARAGAESALGREHAAQARNQRTRDDLIDALGTVPVGLAASHASWQEANAALARELAAAEQRVAAATRAVVEARRRAQLAEARYHAAQAVSPRYEAAALVQIEHSGAKGSKLQLTLRYRTPAALWRPEHLARLQANADGTHTLLWRTFATVWQRTGEDWREVSARFSTARPAQAAEAPLVSDDAVQLQKRQERHVEVEARDQVLSHAGLERGERAVDEMPGVDDGGEPLQLAASHPVTIPSNGAPFRVELEEQSLPCQVETVIFPERAPVAHLRVTCTWKSPARQPAPLLAGPVRLCRGQSLVGRSQVGFVAPGEPFELGFGVDDGLRVRRQIESERETSMLGTLKLTRTVRLFVSNVGGGARQALLTERVPRSELADVKVEVVEAKRAVADAKDTEAGFVRWRLDLAANTIEKLVLVYRVESPSKVQLNF